MCGLTGAKCVTLNSSKGRARTGGRFIECRPPSLTIGFVACAMRNVEVQSFAFLRSHSSMSEAKKTIFNEDDFSLLAHNCCATIQLQCNGREELQKIVLLHRFRCFSLLLRCDSFGIDSEIFESMMKFLRFLPSSNYRMEPNTAAKLPLNARYTIASSRL